VGIGVHRVAGTHLEREGPAVGRDGERAVPGERHPNQATGREADALAHERRLEGQRLLEGEQVLPGDNDALARQRYDAHVRAVMAAVEAPAAHRPYQRSGLAKDGIGDGACAERRPPLERDVAPVGDGGARLHPDAAIHLD
jgi:hypothetical protein